MSILQLGCFQFTTVHIDGLKEEKKILRLLAAAGNVRTWSYTHCSAASTNVLRSARFEKEWRSSSRAMGYFSSRWMPIEAGKLCHMVTIVFSSSFFFFLVRFPTLSTCSSDMNSLWLHSRWITLLFPVTVHRSWSGCSWDARSLWPTWRNWSYVKSETARSSASSGTSQFANTTGTRSLVSCTTARI